MLIHDWTRVTARTWHAFHLSWIAEIQLAHVWGDTWYSLRDKDLWPGVFGGVTS